jgi:hypothetical protein
MANELSSTKESSMNRKTGKDVFAIYEHSARPGMQQQECHNRLSEGKDLDVGEKYGS